MTRILTALRDTVKGDRPLPGYLGGAAWIFGAQVTRGVAALAVVTLGSHLLNVGQFGIFSFVQSFYLWVALLVEFGIATASARILSFEAKEAWARTLSAFIAIFGCITIVTAVLIILTAGSVESWVKLPVRIPLLACALPGLGVLWLTAIRIILPALDHPRLIAATEAAPWVLMLVLILTLGQFFRSATAFSLFFAGSYTVVIVIVTVILVRFSWPSRSDLRMVLSETRRFGLPVFLSRLVSTGGYILDIPLLAAFLHDARLIALYSMAKSLTAPISLLGGSVATALFRRFASAARIQSEAVLLVAGFTAAGVIGYVLAARVVVERLLPPSFHSIMPFLWIWLATSSLNGMYQLPNTFLQARGMGRSLAVLSVLFGASALAGYVILIPRYGVYGACVSALLAVTIWTVGSWWMYARVVR